MNNDEEVRDAARELLAKLPRCDDTAHIATPLGDRPRAVARVYYGMSTKPVCADHVPKPGGREEVEELPYHAAAGRLLRALSAATDAATEVRGGE